MRLKHAAWFVLAAFLVVAGSSACSSSGTVARDTLVVAVNLSDAVTFDPAHSGEIVSVFVHKTAYDQLTEVKATDLGTAVPALADSWESSADRTSYTFKLHPGVKFASGDPLTAEDVRFTFQRDKNMKQTAAAVLVALKEVRVVDEHTVTFILSSPQPGWPLICADPTLGIQDSGLVKQHGGTDAADAPTTDTAQKWLDQNSAGSGPYILTGWTPLKEIIFKANEDYWKGEPSFKRVVLQHSSDTVTALEKLREGSVDIVEGLSPAAVERASVGGSVRVVAGQSLDVTYLGMTSAPQLSQALADVRVRRAVAAALKGKELHGQISRNDFPCIELDT